MESYIDRNAKYMNAIIPADSTDKILKGISNALAYIADELHEQNGWMGDIYECLWERETDIVRWSGGESEETPERSNDESGEECREEAAESPKCFICGKPVDTNDVGGAIIKSSGDVMLACSECAEKFDRCADLAASIVKF